MKVLIYKNRKVTPRLIDVVELFVEIKTKTIYGAKERTLVNISQTVTFWKIQ